MRSTLGACPNCKINQGSVPSTWHLGTVAPPRMDWCHETFRIHCEVLRLRIRGKVVATWDDHDLEFGVDVPWCTKSFWRAFWGSMTGVWLSNSSTFSGRTWILIYNEANANCAICWGMFYSIYPAQVIVGHADMHLCYTPHTASYGCFESLMYLTLVARNSMVMLSGELCRQPHLMVKKQNHLFPIDFSLKSVYAKLLFSHRKCGQNRYFDRKHEVLWDFGDLPAAEADVAQELSSCIQRVVPMMAEMCLGTSIAIICQQTKHLPLSRPWQSMVNCPDWAMIINPSTAICVPDFQKWRDDHMPCFDHDTFGNRME